MDVVSGFAIVVFAVSWWCRSRVPSDERLVVLFFSTLMVLAVAIAVLGFINRQL
jgi:hypothetical protein